MHTPSMKHLGKFLLKLADDHVTCLAGGCTAKQCAAEIDPDLDPKHARIDHRWHQNVRRKDDTPAVREDLVAAKSNVNIKEESSLPFVEVREGTGSKNRKPTKDELDEAVAYAKTYQRLRREYEEAKARFKEHEKLCKHRVSIDYPGYPYDDRSCFACGTSQGLV